MLHRANALFDKPARNQYAGCVVTAIGISNAYD
jgi:hypothetical protein